MSKMLSLQSKPNKNLVKCKNLTEKLSIVYVDTSHDTLLLLGAINRRKEVKYFSHIEDRKDLLEKKGKVEIVNSIEVF